NSTSRSHSTLTSTILSPYSTLFPYTTLFRSLIMDQVVNQAAKIHYMSGGSLKAPLTIRTTLGATRRSGAQHSQSLHAWVAHVPRSEEHTSELQSLAYLVCRLLLEKKKMEAAE